jgi:hypothetical protein
MDIDGTNQIDLRLSAETSAEKANVVVDLSDVDFMASVAHVIGSERLPDVEVDPAASAAEPRVHPQREPL